MLLQAYNVNLEFMGFITDIQSGWKFIRKISDKGSFTFTCPLSDANRYLTSINNIIYYNDQVNGIILTQQIDLNKNTIKVTGCSFEVILEWRPITIGPLRLNSLLQDGNSSPLGARDTDLKHLMREIFEGRRGYYIPNPSAFPLEASNNLKIDNFIIMDPDTNLVPTVSSASVPLTSDKQLDQMVKDYCNKSNAWYKVDFDLANKQFKFYLLPPSSSVDHLITNENTDFTKAVYSQSSKDTVNGYYAVIPVTIEGMTRGYVYRKAEGTKRGLLSRMMGLKTTMSGNPWAPEQGTAVNVINTMCEQEGRSMYKPDSIVYDVSFQRRNGDIKIGECCHLSDSRVGVDTTSVVSEVTYVIYDENDYVELISLSNALTYSKTPVGVASGSFNLHTSTSSVVAGVYGGTSGWTAAGQADVQLYSCDQLYLGATPAQANRYYAIILKFGTAAPSLQLVGPFTAPYQVKDSNEIILYGGLVRSSNWNSIINGHHLTDYRGTDSCPYISSSYSGFSSFNSVDLYAPEGASGGASLDAGIDPLLVSDGELTLGTGIPEGEDGQLFMN